MLPMRAFVPSRDRQQTPQSTTQLMKRQTMRENYRHPSPKTREIQTDIRTFFQPTPKSSPSEAPRSGNPVSRSKAEKSHETLFEEWKAPVYCPPSSRSNPKAKSRSRPTTPEKGQTHTSAKALSPAPLMSTRISTIIDEDLMPKPLKLSLPPAGSRPAVQHTQLLSSRSCSPLPPRSSSEDTCNLIAAIDTKGSFQKSRVLSLFEKQGLGIEKSFADLSTRSHSAKGKSDTAMIVPVALGPAIRSSGLGNEEDAIIYFLPSPEPVLEEPAEMERRIVGRNDTLAPRGKTYGLGGCAGQEWRDGSKQREKIWNDWSADESDEQVAVSPNGPRINPSQSSTPNKPPQSAAYQERLEMAQERRTPTRCTAMGATRPLSEDTTGKKKRKPSKFVRMMEKYSRHVEGLQMIQ